MLSSLATQTWKHGWLIVAHHTICPHGFTTSLPLDLRQFVGSGSEQIRLCLVVGEGDILVQGSDGPVFIRDVLYVPSLSSPLLFCPFCL